MLRVLARLLPLVIAFASVLVWRAKPAAGLPPATHETRDVGFRPMLAGGVLVLCALGAMLGLAAWLYPPALRDRPLRGPVPAFPAPQLQADPARDMAAFHARQIRQLETAWWIDRPAGTVHLPIDQAKRDVARQGIADWPAR